jgi:hypothetical protein
MSPDEFIGRLRSFLKRISGPARRFAIEIRNKDWLDARLTDLLREHSVKPPFPCHIDVASQAPRPSITTTADS